MSKIVPVINVENGMCLKIYLNFCNLYLSSMLLSELFELDKLEELDKLSVLAELA